MFVADRKFSGEFLDHELGLRQAAIPSRLLFARDVFDFVVRLVALEIAVAIAFWDARSAERTTGAIVRCAVARDRPDCFRRARGCARTLRRNRPRTLGGALHNPPATALANGTIRSRHEGRICGRNARRKRTRAVQILTAVESDEFRNWKPQWMNGYFSTRIAWRGAVRTIALVLRAGRSLPAMKSRVTSLRTNLMNASICACISPILSRMFNMISMPARFTPSSRVKLRITSRRSRSESV